MPPGMFLSQPPMTRQPSSHWPITTVSMLSAITSRDTSEYFMPSVPIATASDTFGVPKVCALPPAASIATTAASHSGCNPALHGVTVEWPFAMPIIGLSKSARV